MVSPELEPRACLDWGAGLELQGGQERVGATSGICPSQQGWGVAVLCPSEAVLGLRADPKPGHLASFKAGVPGAPLELC